MIKILNKLRTEGNFLNTTNSIYKKLQLIKLMGFPCSSVVKKLLANEGETGSIPGLGRYPGEGNGSPHQYSCLENPMDRRTWRAVVHKSLKKVEHNLVTITTTIKPKDENLIIFLIISETRQGCPFLTFLFNTALEFPAREVAGGVGVGRE
ncbi:unnamed protein product [Rangifer tarandus platyrhynchus]|uniref:Uncharacterized protein n=1 Tax=Rangifer tarandus platyrhynchus TaxID=3082113 RepID=A0ABN8ZIY6_RANTA|nr:unnamed protein product [Rangifer tarandus platyrhynchus]